jgi:hypothetical protein
MGNYAMRQENVGAERRIELEQTALLADARLYCSKRCLCGFHALPQGLIFGGLLCHKKLLLPG